MRKVVVIVLLLLAVFTFINAYSVDHSSLERTVSASQSKGSN